MSDATLARRAAAPARPSTLRPAAILGTGHHLPAEVVPNATVAERLGVDEKWIVKRTGVLTRRRASDDERMTDLAVHAGRRALTDAGVDAADVDLILVATMSQDDICPNAAPVVAEALGATRAGAIDCGAACTGWLAALSLASSQVETHRADTVLVIGAEVLTRITDQSDRNTAALFGDGAAAAVVGPSANPAGGGVGPIKLYTDGSMAECLVVRRDDPFFRMDGVSTFKAAVAGLSDATHEACRRAGLTLDDIDLFVYHQANARILAAVADRLEVPPAKVADYVAETANTSAASIPLTLCLLRGDGRLRRGQKVLIGAVGAGFTWGAGVIEWELD